MSDQIDWYISHTLQFVRFLMIGNAGGIATCTLALKDLRADFKPKFVFAAVISFGFGLIFSGYHWAVSGNGLDFIRKNIMDAVFSEKELEHPTKFMTHNHALVRRSVLHPLVLCEGEKKGPAKAGKKDGVPRAAKEQGR